MPGDSTQVREEVSITIIPGEPATNESERENDEE
jgi:hypothetical protein